VRKTIYKNDSATLHELVECQEPRMMKWRILDTTKLPFRLKGKKRAPECTIELLQEGAGTAIELAYIFEYADIQFPCCCLAPLTPRAIRFVLVRRLKKVWTSLMLTRGYEDRYELMATRLQAWTKGMAERRNHRKKIKEKDKAAGIDDDDDDDGALPKGKTGEMAPAKTAPSRPQRAGSPPSDANTKPSRPQRDGADTGGGDGGGSAVKIIDDDDSDDELVKMDTISPTKPTRPQRGGPTA
jgi:hypothetical protein